MLHFNEGLVKDELINEIIRIGEAQPQSDEKIGVEGKLVPTKRISEIHWIERKREAAPMIDFFDYMLQQINRHFYGFDCNFIPEYQYTKYRAGTHGDDGHYGWHIDSFGRNPQKVFDRKISFVLQLSDPSEYEGGELEIHEGFGQPPKLEQERMKTKGTLIAFPSYYLHRVTPVTKGERKSLVCWAEGPQFR